MKKIKELVNWLLKKIRKDQSKEKHLNFYKKEFKYTNCKEFYTDEAVFSQGILSRLETDERKENIKKENIGQNQ